MRLRSYLYDEVAVSFVTNSGAVEKEFFRHKERLLGLAYRMLGRWSEAEDVVQEAFVRWSRAENVQQTGAFLVS